MVPSWSKYTISCFAMRHCVNASAWVLSARALFAFPLLLLLLVNINSKRGGPALTLFCFVLFCFVLFCFVLFLLYSAFSWSSAARAFESSNECPTLSGCQKYKKEYSLNTFWFQSAPQDLGVPNMPIFVSVITFSWWLPRKQKIHANVQCPMS